MKNLSVHFIAGEREAKTLCRACVKALRESGVFVSSSLGKNAEINQRCDRCGHELKTKPRS